MDLITLEPSSLAVTLTLRNEDTTLMPAGLGWHPYFPRTPRTTITADVHSTHMTDAFNLLPRRGDPTRGRAC